MSESTSPSGLLAKARATVNNHPVYRPFSAEAKEHVAVTMAYHEMAALKGVNPECWSSEAIAEKVYGLALAFKPETDPGADKLTAEYLEWHYADFPDGPDSIDRESAFNLFTVVTGLPYDRFFEAWLAYDRVTL